MLLLKTHGDSSFASVKEISEARLSYHMDGKVIRFRFPKDSGMSDSLSVTIFQGEMPAGYLTIVEKVHPMNDGHMQLMVMLANDSKMPDGRRRKKLEELLNVAPVSGGVSLSCQGFGLLPQLLEQAEFALQSPRKKEGHFTDYYYLALDHLIRSSYDPNRCLAACHPDVYRLFRQDEVLYQTLWAYLLQDRSVTRTVQMLYVHKNTLLYRLRRIEESLQFDLSDPYTRSYMRTSFFLLERHAGLSDPPVPAFDPSGISSE